MNELPFERLPLRFVSRCPMCNTSATATRMELLDEQDGNVLVYSQCATCGVGLLACLSHMQNGMYGAAILTDLRQSEVEKFVQTQPVTADEVISCFQSLKQSSRKKRMNKKLK